MSLKIKYLDIPQGAQEAARVACLGQPFSDASLITAGAQDVAYATLEPEGWPLDGSRVLFPDAPTTGFWSEEASADTTGILGRAVLGSLVLGSQNMTGSFQTPPVIVLTFPEAYTATGITFTFWPSTEEWCSEICVTWYRGNDVLSQILDHPDAPLWTIQNAVESFDKIEVELLQVNKAGHFAKLQRIEVGQTIWFDKHQITKIHMVNEVDPSLSELTVDTMTVEICDKQGLTLLPQENQMMELYRNGKLEAVQYIVNSQRQARQYYTFSCQSAIGLLEDDYLGGIYEAVPVRDLLEDLLPGMSFELNAIYEDRTVTGYLPICTRREALQQLAFSMGAVVTTHGGAAIRINPIPDGFSSSISPGKIFQGAKVETQPRIAKIELDVHKYTEVDDEETLLEEEPISGEDVLITFSEPHHSYAVAGGTLTDCGANWVKLSAEGNVTLTGKKYRHTTTRHVQANPKATASERNNIYAVEKATLVHQGNIHDVLKRLYGISELCRTVTQEIVVDGQCAGQKVSSMNPWGGVIQGYITSMENDLTPNGHTASVVILGVEKATSALFYAGELMAGDVGGIY